MAVPSFSRGLGGGRSEMGPVATAPTADDMSVDPRSTYGQPGSLDLPPALRGRAGGGLVSVQDRQRTLGTYGYNAAQDARTGGGISSPNNPAGGQPGGDAIAGAGSLGLTPPAWVAPTISNGRVAQPRLPVAYDPEHVEAARQRLMDVGQLPAEGNLPARNYHPSNLARATPQQILAEDANLAWRTKRSQSLAADAYFGGQNQAAPAAPGATPASPTIGPDQAGGDYVGPDGTRQYINPDPNSGFTGGPPLTSSLDPEHQAAVYKAAGQVLALASQIHGIASGAPPPIPAGPINLDAAQAAEDTARDRWQQAETQFPGDPRTKALQFAYEKASQDRVREETKSVQGERAASTQAEKLANKYGFDIDYTKTGAEQLADINKQIKDELPKNQATLYKSAQSLQKAKDDHEAASKTYQELADQATDALQQRTDAIKAKFAAEAAETGTDIANLQNEIDKATAKLPNEIRAEFGPKLTAAKTAMEDAKSTFDKAQSAHQRLKDKPQFRNLDEDEAPPAPGAPASAAAAAPAKSAAGPAPAPSAPIKPPAPPANPTPANPNPLPTSIPSAAMGQVPQNHITALLKNPASAPQFDAIHGPGAAAKVLSGVPPASASSIITSNPITQAPASQTVVDPRNGETLAQTTARSIETNRKQAAALSGQDTSPAAKAFVDQQKRDYPDLFR